MKTRWISLLMRIALAAAFCGDRRDVLAAEPAVVLAETRTYDILVDGKNSGQSTLAITRYSDGSESVTADAKVTVSWTVFSYVYEFHGKEQWRDGRLEHLDSRAVDGGQKLSLTVKRANGGFSIAK